MKRKEPRQKPLPIAKHMSEVFLAQPAAQLPVDFKGMT